MKTVKKQTKLGQNLLNSPRSPVSAWRHYQILKDIEGRIHKLLADADYQRGYLIGLRVGYKFMPAGSRSKEKMKTYEMVYGYGVDDDVRTLIADPFDIITQEVILELYRAAGQLFEANATVAGSFSAILDLTISGSLFQFSIKCDLVLAGQCDANPNHNGQLRILTRFGNEEWKCSHLAC